MIEADQVTTPNLRVAKKATVDGIALDEFGNPTEYHFLKRHPGGQALRTRQIAIDLSECEWVAGES